MNNEKAKPATYEVRVDFSAFKTLGQEGLAELQTGLSKSMYNMTKTTVMITTTIGRFSSSRSLTEKEIDEVRKTVRSKLNCDLVVINRIN